MQHLFELVDLFFKFGHFLRFDVFMDVVFDLLCVAAEKQRHLAFLGVIVGWRDVDKH